MRFAFLEENFAVSGGIRRVIELSNHLVDKGHEVDILMVVDGVPLSCDWLPVKANIKHLNDRGDYDVAIMNHAPVWVCMNKVAARLKVYYWLGFEAGYFQQPTWYDAYQQPFFIIANSPFTADMAEVVYGKRPPVVLGGISPEYFHPVDIKKEYELLCCAPEDKPEKGYFIMKRAADILGLPLENYAIKGLPQDRLAEEYSKAKIFIGMPFLEGSFCPTMEAIACGVPTIMSDCGGQGYYAKDEKNCLVVPRHTGALVQAIKRLRGDSNLQRGFIKNGFETVKPFTWEKCADDFIQVVEEQLK